MNALRSTTQLALVFLALAGLSLPCPASDASQNASAAARNLLSENPRLKQLLAEANCSTGPAEILRLAEAGVDSSVIQKYVETSGRRYDLDADQIIQLHSRGIAPEVISTMIRQRGYSTVQPPSPAPAATSQAVVRTVTSSDEPTSNVTYIRNSPRPIRYAYRPHYVSAYPYSGWSPGHYWGYSYCQPGYWNYRPAWSYDFRFRGCW